VLDVGRTKTNEK